MMCPGSAEKPGFATRPHSGEVQLARGHYYWVLLKYGTPDEAAGSTTTPEESAMSPQAGQRPYRGTPPSHPSPRDAQGRLIRPAS